MNQAEGVLYLLHLLRYANRMNAHINNHSAEVGDDGTLTIVVSAKDPGYGNWLTTGFHDEGTVLMRWVKADHHPLPSCKVVKSEHVPELEPRRRKP